jgi:protein-disulfide isomerase
MRKALSLCLTGLMLCILPTAYAAVSDFDIGQPEHSIPVTEKMMASIRIKAIAEADELVADPYDVVVGNPIGSITLVQFVDFMCKRSAKMDPAIQALIKANPDLRVVYKPFPLRGNVSNDAAKSALIANKQGKYLPYHIALMHVGEGLTEEQIFAIAQSQNLDVKQLREDLLDKQYAEHVAETRKLAQEIGLVGTPALFFVSTDLTKSAKQNQILFITKSCRLRENSQPAVDL